MAGRWPVLLWLGSGGLGLLAMCLYCLIDSTVVLVVCIYIDFHVIFMIFSHAKICLYFFQC